MQATLPYEVSRKQTTFDWDMDSRLVCTRHAQLIFVLEAHHIADNNASGASRRTRAIFECGLCMQCICTIPSVFLAQHNLLVSWFPVYHHRI